MGCGRSVAVKEVPPEEAASWRSDGDPAADSAAPVPEAAPTLPVSKSALRETAAPPEPGLGMEAPEATPAAGSASPCSPSGRKKVQLRLPSDLKLRDEDASTREPTPEEKRSGALTGCEPDALVQDVDEAAPQKARSEFFAHGSGSFAADFLAPDDDESVPRKAKSDWALCVQRRESFLNRRIKSGLQSAAPAAPTFLETYNVKCAQAVEPKSPKRALRSGRKRTWNADFEEIVCLPSDCSLEQRLRAVSEPIQPSA